MSAHWGPPACPAHLTRDWLPQERTTGSEVQQRPQHSRPSYKQHDTKQFCEKFSPSYVHITVSFASSMFHFLTVFSLALGAQLFQLLALYDAPFYMCLLAIQ